MSLVHSPDGWFVRLKDGSTHGPRPTRDSARALSRSLIAQQREQAKRGREEKPTTTTTRAS